MNIKIIEYNHIKNIKQNELYMNIINMIIGDMLMGKVKKYNNSIHLINITDKVDNLIKNWYNMANDLKKYNKHPFSVYRGVRNMDDNDVIYQPIPFSTCIEFDNALNWTYNNGFIMKINIKIGDMYTFTGNKYEGREVILPRCVLKKISSIKENEVVINEYNMYSLISCFYKISK